MKGVYLLLILLDEQNNIRIGSLGHIKFQKGIYVYVGSAMGSKGSSTLLNRVKRHLKKPNQKKLHWHIDYFLNDVNSKIIRIYLIPSKLKLECKIATELKLRSEGFINNFGCSDCECISHLLYFKNIAAFENSFQDQNNGN